MSLRGERRGQAGGDERTLADAGGPVQQESGMMGDQRSHFADLALPTVEKGAILFVEALQEFIGTSREFHRFLRGPARRGRRGATACSHEHVTALGQGLDVTGLCRLVAQRLANVLDTLAQRRVTDEAVVPDVLEKFVATDRPTRVLYEKDECIQIFGVERQGVSVAEELTVGDIEVEFVEIVAVDVCRFGRGARRRKLVGHGCRSGA